MKSVFILLFALTPLFCAIGQDANLLSRLAPVPPFLELQAFAKTNDISLSGIGPMTATNVQPGDSLTALITLHQKRNRLTQWLVYFEVVAASNQPSSKPPKPTVIYDSMGDKYEYSPAPVEFRIRTIGPYVNFASMWGAPVPKDDSGRASVNGTFLALGMDKSMAALYRIEGEVQKTGATNVNLQTWGRPPPAALVKRNQKRAELLHITTQEKSALATAGPTLNSYFEAVGETPGLDGIMWKVISLPSVWSIVKHRGITGGVDFQVQNLRKVPLPSGWNLPGHDPIYALPLTVMLNEKPALDVTLLITRPVPSLMDCGGIVGFVAQNPDDDQDYMNLRVISARGALKR